MRDGLAGLQAEAIERGIELVQAGGHPELQVVADGPRLQRVVHYLTSTALRATRGGARVCVETEVEERREIVRFRSERGEAEPRGPARAGEANGASAPEDDSWAGLAIATHIVEEHLGTVKVDRAEAGGFVASMELPLDGATMDKAGLDGGPARPRVACSGREPLARRRRRPP